MSERRKTVLRSDMGWSDATRIRVQGIDLIDEIMGRLDLGQFAFLEIFGRVPSPAESKVFNAMLCTLVEHGMTPMAIATRLTYLGAPESLQGAVAAGLLGVGTTFAGTAEGSARMLHEALDSQPENLSEQAVSDLSEQIVKRLRDQRQSIPGIGHNLHKPVDPRAVRLFEIAAEHGFSGRYVALMKQIAAAAERAMNKPGLLPVNVTGALGALACELGIPWRLCRGLAVMGRAVGLVGHIGEELRNPLAREIWERVEEEASSHVLR